MRGQGRGGERVGQEEGQGGAREGKKAGRTGQGGGGGGEGEGVGEGEKVGRGRREVILSLLGRHSWQVQSTISASWHKTLQ